MKILAAHQPQYLPWLGYFDKLDRADVFVLLDNVQFKKNEWQNRNRIRTAAGWQWLTVPVRHRFGQRIEEVKIAGEGRWRRKHLRALELNYGGATHAADHLRAIEEILMEPWTHLVELNVALIRYFVERLGIDTPVLLASELSTRGRSTSRLVELCLDQRADVYLSGRGATEYLDTDAFDRVGVEILWQDFCQPVYRQAFEPFEPHLSVVDLLLNCGDASLTILRSTRHGLDRPAVAAGETTNSFTSREDTP